MNIIFTGWFGGLLQVIGLTFISIIILIMVALFFIEIDESIKKRKKRKIARKKIYKILKNK